MEEGGRRTCHVSVSIRGSLGESQRRSTVRVCISGATQRERGIVIADTGGGEMTTRTDTQGPAAPAPLSSAAAVALAVAAAVALAAAVEQRGGG